MYLAVDIGGTYVKQAIITREGHIRKEWKMKTPTSLKQLLASINVTLHREFTYEIKGVAVSSPGTVLENGKITGTSAVPYIHHVNMREEIERATGLPVTIENDANCAALAEVWKGAAASYNDAAFIILGTGVGGALIKNRKLHKGKHLLGGEIGYTLLSIDPEKRTLKQWSQVASTKAMVRLYAEKKGLLLEEVTGEDVFQKAEKGDSTAKEIIDAFFFCLGAGIYNLHYIYNPDIILVGGGISSRPGLLNAIQSALTDIFNQLPDLELIYPNVEICHFRGQANLVGALYAHIQRNY